MATKKTKSVAKLPAMANKEKAEKIAKATLLPSVNAAAVVAEYAKAFGDQDLCALVDELRPHMNDVNDGNLQRCEAMLVGQAHALQSIFAGLDAAATINEAQTESLVINQVLMELGWGEDTLPQEFITVVTFFFKCFCRIKRTCF